MSSFEKSKKYTGVQYKLLQNGDKSYYITYKIGTKFKRIHIGKKSEGVNEAFCHQKRNDAINVAKFGDDIPIVKYKRKKATTLGDLADIYFTDKEFENSSNKGQLGKYNMHIKPVFGESDVFTMTKEDILNFRNSLVSTSKAPKSINGIIQLLTAIVNYSIKEKGLKIVNPCTGVKRLKVDNYRERFLTLPEVAKLKDEVRDDLDMYLFVLLALNTGNRVQDILKIQKKDIDLIHDTISLTDTKNNSRYKGFFDSETKQVLKKTLSKLRSNHYVIGGNIERYPLRTLQRKLLKIMDKLFNQGLNKDDTKNRAVIHTLRHTFASQLAIAGTPIYTIQRLMNHADIQQTMRYAKLAPDSGKDAVRNLYN